MNQLIKSKGVNFGLVYGLFLSLLVLYAYVVDLNFFTSYWLPGLMILGFLVHGFWVIGSLKKAQEGFVTFKEAFTVFFIANALGLLLSTILTILIFVVIDPDLQTIVKDLTITKTTEMMENFGAQGDQIEKTIEGIKEQDNYSVGAQIKGYFMTLAISSIFGLLFSLILKKKKEETY
jgi:hypothetical protein